MMEAIQIIFNLLFLGALAWWLCREKVREVSREEFDESEKQGLAIFQAITDKLGNHQVVIEELQDTIVSLQGQRASGGEIADAIKTGAVIAQRHIDAGAKLVLDALARDGQVARVDAVVAPREAVNLGEDDYSFAPPTTTEIPDIIIARNERHAEQIGDKVLDELMKGMK